jgi:hypothetical protein
VDVFASWEEWPWRHPRNTPGEDKVIVFTVDSPTALVCNQRCRREELSDRCVEVAASRLVEGLGSRMGPRLLIEGR